MARPLLAYATDADPDTLITMSESMKQTFGLVRRPWGVFYLKHKITGVQTSLKTSDKFEAQRIPKRTTNRRFNRTSTCRWRGFT